MSNLATLSLREALRGFARQKSLFATAVLTLVLGLSLCIAMVCVLYAVLLRPLSYGHTDRLVMAWAGYEGGASERDTFDAGALETWRQATHTLDGVAGVRYAQYTLLQRGEPTSLQGAVVSPELFSTLTLKAQVGQVFTPAMSVTEQGKVALLSHKLWRQRFDSSPNVAGTPVNLGDEVYTVVGVLPDGFDFPSNETAVWVPLPPGPGQGRGLMVVGRLRDSVGIEQAQADTDAVARQLTAEAPDTRPGMRIHLVPFFDELTKESRPMLLVGAAAALLALLICCANISNLLLVRAIVRRSEFATRSAIGAQRRHLLGVVFAEGLVLAVCAGVASAVAARWLIVALLHLSPVELPRAATIGTGLQIPAIALVLLLVTTLLISLPAAWEVVRARLSLVPTQETRSTSRRFARQLIVTLQMAVALTLLAGAGLMTRSMLALRDADPGWKTDHLLVGQVFLPRRTYQTPPQMQQFFENFMQRLRGVPGVVSVAASSAVPATPLGIDVDLPIQVPGRVANSDGRGGIRAVTPGFFQTLGIPLIQGRHLDESDGDPQLRRIVVNQAFARQYLADAPSPIGRQVNVFLGAPQAYEVVGVVGDVHHYGMLREPKPEFYMPLAIRPFSAMGIVVRTQGDPLVFAAEFRKQLWALDPELPIASLDSMENMVEATWSDRGFLTIMLGLFTLAVVVLTAVGVFSVVTFSVSRQVREIGIRMALGARGEDIVRMVMGQSARTVVAGVLLGLGGAWMLGRSLASLMYRVSASDPLVLAAGAIGLAVIAAVGTYLPSRRAARIEPAPALRIE